MLRGSRLRRADNKEMFTRGVRAPLGFNPVAGATLRYMLAHVSWDAAKSSRGARMDACVSYRRPLEARAGHYLVSVRAT